MRRLLGCLIYLGAVLLLNGCSDSVDGSSVDSGVVAPAPSTSSDLPPEPKIDQSAGHLDCGGYSRDSAGHCPDGT